MLTRREEKVQEERKSIALYRRVAAWELKNGSPRIAAQIDVLADYRERNLPFVGCRWYDPRGWRLDPSAKALHRRLNWPAIGDAMRRAGIRDRAAAAKAAREHVIAPELLS